MEDAAIIGLYWARDEGAIAASDEKYGKRTDRKDSHKNPPATAGG